MDNLIILAICTIITIGYSCVKIYELKLKFHQKPPEDEFIGDLYKLQQKWAIKGKVDFAEAVGIIIKGFSLPPVIEEDKKEVGYNYSSDYIEKLKKANES